MYLLGKPPQAPGAELQQTFETESEELRTVTAYLCCHNDDDMHTPHTDRDTS